MRCVYNGIDLMPLETHYFDCEPVYDPTGTDYLYTKVSMAVRAVVNGQASVAPLTGAQADFINYGFGPRRSPAAPLPQRADPVTVPRGGVGGLNVPPGAEIDAARLDSLRAIIRNPPGLAGVGGMNPSDLTHQAIRFRLSIPRRKLFIFWGAGFEILGPPGVAAAPPVAARLFITSPEGNNACDAKNGPFPRILSVIQAEGDANSLIVDWAVETYVIESRLNEVTNTGGLLSNRFSQLHEIDETGWTRMTTTGTAIFRADTVFTAPQSPDASRPFLFMPILGGFKRTILYVKGREDATGVDYSYQDTQVPVNFVAGPFAKAQKISVLHRQAVSSNPDFLGSALQAYERGLSILVNRKWAKDKPEAPAPAGAAARKGPPPVPAFNPWKLGEHSAK